MIETPIERATTGRERLYRAFEEFVEPTEYRGDDCASCLVGQTAQRLAETLGQEDRWLDMHDARYLADHFGIPMIEIMRLYGDVNYPPYARSYEAAMALARKRFAP